MRSESRDLEIGEARPCAGGVKPKSIEIVIFFPQTLASFSFLFGLKVIVIPKFDIRLHYGFFKFYFSLFTTHLYAHVQGLKFLICISDDE